MKKFAAVLRSILITIAMIVGLVICVIHANFEITPTSYLIILFLGVVSLYIVVSIVSLAVRGVKRARLDENSRMKESFTDILQHY